MKLAFQCYMWKCKLISSEGSLRVFIKSFNPVSPSFAAFLCERILYECEEDVYEATLTLLKMTQGQLNYYSGYPYLRSKRLLQFQAPPLQI